MKLSLPHAERGTALDAAARRFRARSTLYARGGRTRDLQKIDEQLSCRMRHPGRSRDDYARKSKTVRCGLALLAPYTQLFAPEASRDFLHRAFGEMPEMERPVLDADQARDL